MTDDFFPCSMGVSMLHLIIVVFTGFNTLLTTWLTHRAVQKDKNGAAKKSNAPDDYSAAR